MSLNLGTILRASAERKPDSVVLRAGDGSMSYAELDRAAAGVAHGLRERGIQPGDKVALLVPNVPEFTIAYFGILYAGAAVVPINVLAAAPEVAYFLKDSEARLLVVHPLFAEPGQAGAAEVDVPVVVAGGEGTGSLAELAAGPPLDFPEATGADDTAVILYTSGTTGQPKGAELTHSNLLPELCVRGAASRSPFRWRQPARARDASALPLVRSDLHPERDDRGRRHIHPAAALRTRGSLPTDGARSASRSSPACRRCTSHCSTTRASDEYDVSSLELCMTGGAPMPVEVMGAFEKKFERRDPRGLRPLRDVACFAASTSSASRAKRARSATRSGVSRWRSSMTTTSPLPDDERGEICIRGHNIMKGYLNRPDATKETMKNGWFHSGDIGLRDERRLPIGSSTARRT